MADTQKKRLNPGDVFTVPYKANKIWEIESSSFSSKGITFEEGTYPIATNTADFTRANLVYRSLLANYYPEFYSTNSIDTSSYNQTIYYTQSLSSASNARYGLNLGNPATTEKYFPTFTGSYVFGFGIPKSLYGEKIEPGTFYLQISGGTIYDDGEYNLRWSGSDGYYVPSGSLLIRTNNGVTFPTNMQTLRFTDYAGVSHIQNVISYTATTAEIESSIGYTNGFTVISSSFTASYFIDSASNGTDLTAYSDINTNFIAESQTTYVIDPSGSTVFGMETVGAAYGNGWLPIQGPLAPGSPLSASFGPGSSNPTLLTVSPSANYFLSGGIPVSTAQIIAISGSSTPDPIGGANTFFTLEPNYTINASIPALSILRLGTTSHSFEATDIVSQSSFVFPANIVDKSGSITVGGTNYPIVSYVDGVHVQVSTPIEYTASTNFTYYYTASAALSADSISAGDLIFNPDPNVTSSIGNVLSQSSYVGNIFYEQGVGVLTQIPITIVQ